MLTDSPDFNAQLGSWLATVNARVRRALGCTPTDRIDADLAAMCPLPSVARVTGCRSSTRLARNHYVRFDGNDYSVHPAVIGRRIEVAPDLARGPAAPAARGLFSAAVDTTISGQRSQPRHT